MNFLFDYSFQAEGLVDIGIKRTSNQDEVIIIPEFGFFAVSDGMGGLVNGKETAAMIAQMMPEMIENASAELKSDVTPEYAAQILCELVCMISDNIFDTANKGGQYHFGATLSGVWLVGTHAVFVNLGDSRGYYLKKRKRAIRQITKDHSNAAIMVEQGELTALQAKRHPASSQLNRFVGMSRPALPETFIEKILPGDCLLLCSDGLHGMVEEHELRKIMIDAKSGLMVCQRMVDKANQNGGDDNISVVYIKIGRKNLRRTCRGA